MGGITRFLRKDPQLIGKQWETHYLAPNNEKIGWNKTLNGRFWAYISIVQMNGSNLFYKNDGSALPNQFWNENGPPSAAAASVSNANQGKNTFNDGRIVSTGESNSGPMGPYPGGFSVSMGYQNAFDMRPYQPPQAPFQGAPMQNVNSNVGLGLIGSGSNPSSPQPGTNGSSKKRVARACDHCRKRKIKCDSVNPETKKCTNCTKYNAKCTFQVREDVERRKRGYEQSETAGSGTEELNVLNFGPPSATTANAPPLGIYQDDQIYKSISQGSLQRSHESTKSPDLGGKVEKLDKKVASISKSLKDVELLLKKLIDSNEACKDVPEQSKPKLKRYYSAILTPEIVTWIDKRLNTHGTKKSISSAINEILTITLKWQMIQTKVIADFSAPMIRNGKFQLHPLPPQAQAKRIIESFRSAMLVSSAPSLVATDYYASLISKFYKGETLSYAELLLLHVSISFGAARMRVVNPGDSYTLRKDRFDPSKEELRTIECDSLLNAIYYYNKVLINGASLAATQGLMLLSLHLRETLDTSLAFGVFSTAVKFAFDLGLHQRFSYLNVTLEEEIIRRSVWWHCAYTDKWFSLTQSRPALIKEQDMDMLSDQNYFDFMKRLMRLKGPSVAEDVGKLTSLKSCLDYAINYCDLLPAYVSYYSLKVTKIEARVAQQCFSVRTTMDSSSETIIDRVLRLRDDLIEWDETLHPSMQLNTYKSYLSVLYVRDPVDDPALTYEVACSRVIRCHFRNMNTRILLGLFALAFVADNATQLEQSRNSTSSIHRLFLDDIVEISMKMLRAFATTDYERHIYTNLLYCLLTGVFALVLYVLKYSKEDERHKITEILDLLIASHLDLVGENEEYLVSDNPKWNTSVFFFTILLSSTIKYCEENTMHSKYYTLNFETYQNMLKKIVKYSNTIKDRSLDRFVFYTNCFRSTEEYTKSSEDATQKDVSKEDCASQHLLSSSFSPFIGTDEATLTFFRSSKSFTLSTDPSPGYKELKDQIYTDSSLFRAEDPPSRSSPDIFGIEPFHQDAAEKRPKVAITTDANDMSNDGQEVFHPHALFFDRDLFFSNVLAERLVPLT